MSNEQKAVGLNPIVMLAKACPKDYPMTSELKDVKEFIDLSRALSESGFRHLAKAVLGGIAWSRRIANGESLSDQDDDAALPGWSWNRSA